MNLRSAALAAIVATLYASCIARSAATATIANPATALGAIQSPNEVQQDSKRFLRTPGVEANEEERGWPFSSISKLSAGAETLSKKQLKALVDKTVKNPQFYDDLVMADLATRIVSFGTWEGLGVDTKILASRMKKAGYGGEDYNRFVADYAKFLSGDIRIQ